jgi:hypothetical protein
MTAGMHTVVVDPLDAHELVEMLEFLAAWLEATPAPCQQALDAFSPGYGAGELRAALIEFSRLLERSTP